MGKTLEFLFDVGSPASYIAWKRMPAFAAETGATVDYQPFLLGGVFKATGNHSPAEIPAKGAWMMKDLGRFAARHGITYRRNPNFPINTLHLMRAAMGLRDDPRFMAYVDAVYDHMFGENPKNLGDPAELVPVLEKVGIAVHEFKALTEDEAVKARLKDVTERAVARGAFGAPTFFVDGELFFGQDRMDFVAEALTDA